MNNTQLKTTIKDLMENPFAGYGLTEKQKEACRLVALGCSPIEAAEKIGISRQALQERLEVSLGKLGLKKHSELTTFVFTKLWAIVC